MIIKGANKCWKVHHYAWITQPKRFYCVLGMVKAKKRANANIQQRTLLGFIPITLCYIVCTIVSYAIASLHVCTCHIVRCWMIIFTLKAGRFQCREVWSWKLLFLKSNFSLFVLFGNKIKATALFYFDSWYLYISDTCKEIASTLNTRISSPTWRNWQSCKYPT